MWWWRRVWVGDLAVATCRTLLLRDIQLQPCLSEVTGAWLSMVTRISSPTCFHQPASASSVAALTTQRAPRPRPAEDIFVVALASESEAQALAETVERPCTILRGGPCTRRHKRHSSPMARPAFVAQSESTPGDDLWHRANFRRRGCINGCSLMYHTYI